MLNKQECEKVIVTFRRLFLDSLKEDLDAWLEKDPNNKKNKIEWVVIRCGECIAKALTSNYQR